MRQRLACPCCGFLTLGDLPPRSYEICEVCFWEDDPRQFESPDSDDGANGISLNEARENFEGYGASAPEYLRSVREPRRDEILMI